MPRANLTADRYAAAVGQPNIEHRDIGFGQWNSHPSLDGGAGLAHDLDGTAGLQQILEAATNHVVIVKDEHPGHSPTCPLGSACRAHRVKQTPPAGAEPARPGKNARGFVTPLQGSEVPMSSTVLRGPHWQCTSSSPPPASSTATCSSTCPTRPNSSRQRS